MPASPELLHALQRLLERLRRAGWRLGLGDFDAVQHLVLSLHRQGRLPDKRTLRGLLGPLLCRSPAQQRDFAYHYDLWLQEDAFPEIQPAPIAEPAVPAQTAPEPKTPQKPPRRVWLWFLLLPVALAAGAGWFCYSGGICPWQSAPEREIKQQIPPPQQPDPTPVAPPAPESPVPVKEQKALPQAEPVASPLPFYRAWLPWSALLFLPFLCWVLIKRLNRRYLRRRLVSAPPDFASLHISASARRLYQSAKLPGVAQQLHRHDTVPGPHLDVAATLHETLRNLGLFTPVQGTTYRRPEYLVLVERVSPADQQAQLVDDLVSRLRHEGVVISLWYYQGDPRFCYPAHESESAPRRGGVFENKDSAAPRRGLRAMPASLAELATRYAGWRLLVFGSGHAFLEPVSGQPAAWLRELAAWPQRALFTLEPPDQWRYLQRLLGREDILIAPADEHGLRGFLHSLHSDVPPVLRFHGKPYPRLLTEHEYNERRAPPETEQKALLAQLRAFLDEDGYRWLAACGVYPELHWQLTLHLGECLEVLDEARLSRLAILPWLRNNYMPDWLRNALLDSLSPEERTSVRGLLLQLLQQPPMKDQQSCFETRLAKGRNNKRRAREQVCVDFIAGGLALPLPDLLRPNDEKRRKQTWLALWLSLGLFLFVTAWQSQAVHDKLRDWLTGSSTRSEEPKEPAKELSDAGVGLSQQFNALLKDAEDVKESNPELSQEYAERALQLAETMHSFAALANAFNAIGEAHTNQVNYRTALSYHVKSLEKWTALGKETRRADVLLDICIAYWKLSEYEQAMPICLDSLRIYENQKNLKGTANALHHLGIINDLLLKYEKALDFHHRSLAIRESIGDRRGIADSLNNIGIVYYFQNKYEDALKYHMRALEVRKESNDIRGIAKSLTNVALCYQGMNQPQEGLKYSMEALERWQQLGDKYETANVFNNIGEFYTLLRDFGKAYEYLQSGLDLAEEAGAKELQRENYEYWAKLYTARNDYKNAWEYSNKAFAIKDQIHKEKSNKVIADIQTKYETEKKEKEIDFLVKNSEINKLQRTSFLGGIILIFILVILLIALVNYRRKLSKLSQGRGHTHQVKPHGSK